MMEMLEEKRQSSDEVDVQEALDQILSILKTSISEPVIAVYKTKLNATLDLEAIRGILETTQPDLDTKNLTQKTAVEQLDLDAWLNLILQRWDLFDPILKNMGKNAVEKLCETHNDRMDDVQVSTRDARNVAVLAHEMLLEFYCKPQAEAVGVIRDKLTSLAQLEDSPVVQATATPLPSLNGHAEKVEKNGHRSGIQDKPETPASTNGNHKHESIPVSSNGNGSHAKAAALPETEILKDQPTPKPAPRIDKSRTRRVAPPPPNSTLQLEIVKQQGVAFSQKIDLTKPSVLVGRSLMADIEISDARVSRVHLLIAGTLESGIKVTDLHSANGTFIDGIPLVPNSPTEWDIGQMVTIGETMLVLRHTV